jgi:hypothetical protein
MKKLETRSHLNYALMLLASFVAIAVVVRLLSYVHLLDPNEAGYVALALMLYPTLFFGKEWLAFYRETHPYEESNRAMDIIRSLPPECQDHILRFLEGKRFSSGQVDRETQRITNIFREIPITSREAVLAAVTRTVEQEPQNDDSFYNVGYYKTS